MKTGSVFGYVVYVVVLMAIHCNVLSTAILHPMDFLALQSIRKSLDDFKGSTFFSTWDFTSDPCNFTGVFCLQDRVVSLYLGDPRAGSPGLIGRLDPAIGKLSALAEFTLVPGRVIGTLPSSFSQCTNLRFLALARNFISGGIPASLGDLRALQTLDLSYNLLTGEIPHSVGNLPALRNVILCHNKLSGSLPHFVSQSLTKFDLKHNDLSGSLSSTSLPTSLQYLSLSSNRLAGPVHTLLERLARLNYLDLSLNNFNGPIPSNLFTFPITTLQLQRNAFSGRILPPSQVTIPTVDLSFNRLYGDISPMFSTVQNLYLNNNRFSGEVPPSLVDRLLSADIQVLYLQHNFLTGIPMNSKAEIPVSSSLCLQYNCMVPPVQTPCPLRSGKQITRPATQCGYWKKLSSLFGVAADHQYEDDNP
uniref:Leucine-rich repeat-containing N-terminal plant-type domain-containing protein n=1 Tax=Kalanchoe fedtschenkoi TaxID=63787 RepID=A0A7N0VCE2_KALFE